MGSYMSDTDLFTCIIGGVKVTMAAIWALFASSAGKVWICPICYIGSDGR